MPRYVTPGYVSSLKQARYWSLDWIAENGIAGPFQYVVLLKADGAYKVIGQYATATEAFEDRRRLVEESGIRTYFLRAVRVIPVEETEVVDALHPESREDLDRWRDALDTGNEDLIPSAELPSFRSWAAATIENRPEYRRPASRGGLKVHGEIPF
jgi:hypothetical protein